MDLIDATKLGSRIQDLLAKADVEPPSVPPSSILLVRRLSDPARGALLREADVYAPSDRWVRAARAELDHLYRHASRPADGPTSASAPAVLFRDHAEMLACLSRDFLLGSVSVCWWWQSWFRATNVSSFEDVLRAWCRAARHAPASIAMLHRGGYAAPFLRALSSRQARALFVAMAEAYGVPALAAPTAPVESADAAPRRALPGAHQSGCSTVASDDAEGSQAIRVDTVSPPWEALLPSSSVPATLGLEQRTLLGIALVLWRAPLAVRGRAFHRAFHAWRRAEQFKAPTAPEGASRRERAVVTQASPAALAGDTVLAPLQFPRRQDGTRSEALETARPMQPGGLLEGSGAAAKYPAPVDDAPFEGTPREEAASTAAATPPETPSTSDPTPRGTAGAAPPTEPAPSELPSAQLVPPTTPAPGADPAPAPPVPAGSALPRYDAESIGTRLGGVLFLINVLQHFELFDRLDDHFGVVSSIGGWAWLEIVARSLLGDRRSDAATDPLWDALAALDGREPGEAVSARLRGPRSYRLPDGWPMPSDPDPATSLRRAVRPLGLKPTGDLRRILRAVIPYLRWRLLRAMAIEARSPREEDALLAARLLYRRGRMTRTSTHVDLHMRMDQVDIDVRLAGLDANPGWVPALGRVVTFYFEQE